MIKAVCQYRSYANRNKSLKFAKLNTNIYDTLDRSFIDNDREVIRAEDSFTEVLGFVEMPEALDFKLELIYGN